MNSNSLDPAQVAADQVAALIKGGLSSSIASIDQDITPVTIESLTKTMEEVLGKLDNRKIINAPDFSRDLKISWGEIPVYKIFYKTQLNSIEFIKGEEEVKTKTFLCNGSLEEAQEKAPRRIEKNARILKVVLDHYEEDHSMMNIEYRYRPVIAISYHAIHMVVKV